MSATTTGIIITRVFLTISLALSLLAFTTLSAATHAVSEEAIHSTIIETSNNLIEDQLLARSDNATESLETIHEELLRECSLQNDQTIRIEEADLELSCSEIEAVGIEEIKTALQESVSERVTTEIQEALGDKSLGVIPQAITFATVIFGVLTLLIAILLFFMSKPVPIFTTHLGIAALLAGLPVLVLEKIVSTIKEEVLYRNASAQAVLEIFFADVSMKLLVALITGSLLIALSVANRLMSKNASKLKK